MANRAAVFRRGTVLRSNRRLILPLRPPIVNVGPDATALNRSTFTRTATIDDAAYATQEWVVVSGPARVGESLSATSTVSFTPTVPGVYVLRHSASNAAGTGFDELSLDVTAVVVPLAGAATGRGTAPSVDLARVAVVRAAASSSGRATATLRASRRVAAQPVARGTTTSRLVAARRVGATATARGTTTSTLRRALRMRSSPTGRSTATGVTYKIRPIRSTATARGTSPRAYLRPTSTGYARGTGTATGNLVRLRTIAARPVARGSTLAMIERVVMYRQTMRSRATALASAKNVVLIRRTARASGAARGTQLPIVVLRAEDARSYATIRPARLRSVTRLAYVMRARAYTVGVQYPARRLARTLIARGTATATFRRVTTTRAASANARGRVLNARMIGVRLNRAIAPLFGRGRLTGQVRRAVPMFSLGSAEATIEPPHIRRVAKFFRAIARAVATAIERPDRVVETTAQSYAYADIIEQLSVNVIRGYTTALSEAFGDLVLGARRHVAKSTASARGHLRPVRRLRETAYGDGLAEDVDLRSIYQMSTVVREITFEEMDTMNAQELRTHEADVPFSDEDEIPQFERVFLSYRT